MAANVQDNSFDDDVYTGIWINRSYGPIYGATLTLTRQNGGFLIAFLAMYVGVTGKSFWKITRFLLHSFFSSTALPNGIYHQQQAILRNSKSALDAVEEVLYAMFAWRKRARKNSLCLIPVLALAFIVTASFAIAGIFSSHVTTNNVNEVVLSGSGCETNLSFDFGQDAANIRLNQRRKVSEYLAYALDCYQGWQANQSQKCQIYTKPSLPYILDSNAKCPFSKEICQQDSSNILLDSGFLDSNNDFGINIEPRFLFRLKRQCAPLVTHGFSKLYTDPQNPSTKFMRYTYGRSKWADALSGADSSFIYQVPVNEAPSSLASVFRSETADYRTGGVYTSPTDRDIFAPIPELDRSDALVSLLFLTSDGIWSREKIEDPWFAATKLVLSDMDLIPNGTRLFISDEPAGVLGCTLQTWYCNPKLPEQSRCVNLYESSSLERLPEIWPDAEDLAAIQGFQSAVGTFTLVQPHVLYNSPGIPSLLARSTLIGPIQLDALPPNKWQQQMEYSYQASLVSLQSAPVEVTRRGAFWPNETICPTAVACQKLCRNQKIKSLQFYSFSVLGVSIIIFTGLFFIILGTFVESVAAFIIQLRGYKNSKSTYAWLEWEANSALQLQRLAHEGLGLGTWSRTASSVPITEPEDTLGILDLTDPEHPRLQHPASAEELSVMDPIASDEAKSFHISTAVMQKESPWGPRISYDSFRPRYYNSQDNLGGDTQNRLYSPLNSSGRDSFTNLHAAVDSLHAGSDE